jgi:hypothetical protein
MRAELDRRLFLKLSVAGAAVAVVSLPTLGCSTAWITTVLNDLPVVISIAQSIVAVVAEATGNGALAPIDAALISAAASALSTGLTALQDAVNAYNSNNSGGLAPVIAALLAAQTDATKVVSSLVAAGVTVNSDVQMIITAAMGTAATILAAIQSLIPGAAPASVTAKATATVALGKVTMPNAESLKYGYNSVLWLHGMRGHTI